MGNNYITMKKLFKVANTEAALDDAVSNDTLDAHVTFIAEEGNEGIYASGKKYKTLPSNGREGEIIKIKEGKPTWVEDPFSFSGDEEQIVFDYCSYGVEWKPDVADPELTRVGNMHFHRTLPIHSGMKGCIVQAKGTATLQYWLKEDNWNLKKDEVFGKIRNSIYIASTEENYYFDDDGNWVTAVAGDLAMDYNFKKGYSLIEDRIAIYDNDDNLLTYALVVGVTILPTAEGETVLSWLIRPETPFTPSPPDTLYKINLDGARLDGYDGEVMVYVPEFWIKSWDEPDRRCVRICPFYLDGWEHQPAVFIAAYHDTVLNTVPENMGYLSTLPVNSAISVVNSSTYCRGGNADPLNDDAGIAQSPLGKCITNIPRSTFRNYARNSGKEILSYRQYKNIFYWLYVIEYANFRANASFNHELTSDGFHQGGLGNGVRHSYLVVNSEAFPNPVCPNGYTNELGNSTGIIPLNFAFNGYVDTIRWRGIENPWGDVTTILDGVIINSRSIINNGVHFGEVYSTDNPNLYSETDYQLMDKVGEEPNEASADSRTLLIKEWNLGNTAEIIPRQSIFSGAIHTYKCGWHSFPEVSRLGILVMGSSRVDTRGSLSNYNSLFTDDDEFKFSAYRTCYIP